MKHLIKTTAAVALLTMPLTAYAQSAAAPKTQAPAASGGMMMNCPMMGEASSMQKDMGGMMSDMQATMKNATDPAMKERMQKMHGRMSAMMASMQKMGGQQPGNAAPAKPETAPVSPDDHAAH